MDLQINKLFKSVDELHCIHGANNLNAIYGAGEINSPKICLVFMNPTSKNISTSKTWKGLRAPWLGTKNVWNLLFKLGLIKNSELLDKINSYTPSEWSDDFCHEVYQEVKKSSLYITNLAKCTQIDAKVLSNKVYRDFLPLILQEIEILKPIKVITFGNQVSSILIGKNISVSKYLKDEFETIEINNDIITHVFPCYYPIGQGTPNIGKAMERIKMIL